jgi:hypothetical protein
MLCGCLVVIGDTVGVVTLKALFLVNHFVVKKGARFDSELLLYKVLLFFFLNKMFNCTEIPFMCLSRIEIVGSLFDGSGWFFVMLLVAFGLQNSQYSREILQLKIEDPKRKKLIGFSVLWTAIETVVWIISVIFLMGNNLWMFISILLGNVAGTYWSSIQQPADEENTLDIIIQECKNRSKKAYELQKALFELPQITPTKLVFSDVSSALG